METSSMEYNKEIRQISNISRIITEHLKPNKVLTPDQIKTNDHILRIVLSLISFVIAISWLIFVGFVVYAFFIVNMDSKASDKVMITLLTTTTITVVGLPSLVLQGIYKVLQEENKALELKNKLNNQ